MSSSLLDLLRGRSPRPRRTPPRAGSGAPRARRCGCRSPVPSRRWVIRWIFWMVSGVKMVPSSTTRAMATSAEPPNLAENLSWARMKGWSGHWARATVSTRTEGAGQRVAEVRRRGVQDRIEEEEGGDQQERGDGNAIVHDPRREDHGCGHLLGRGACLGHGYLVVACSSWLGIPRIPRASELDSIDGFVLVAGEGDTGAERVNSDVENTSDRARGGFASVARVRLRPSLLWEVNRAVNADSRAATPYLEMPPAVKASETKSCRQGHGAG